MKKGEFRDGSRLKVRQNWNYNQRLRGAILVYITNIHILPNTDLFSQFWKPEVRNQDVYRVRVPLKALWDHLFLAFSSFW